MSDKCKCSLRGSLVGDGCEHCNPEMARAVETLEDVTEIFYSEHTQTTRWVLYRHHETKNLNLAIVQGNNTVSVGIQNLKYLLGTVVPKHE